MDNSLHEVIAEKISDFMSSPIPSVFERDLSLGNLQIPNKGNLVNVVVGIRRCGKTCRMYQEMQRILDAGYPKQSILYFNFEDERLKPYTSSLLAEVMDTFQGMCPETQHSGSFLFFDEIQEVPDWGVFLRRMVDTQKATIYVTGSSSKLISSELATEFRGRSISRELFPMSFSEFARFHYPYIDENTDKSELLNYRHIESMPGSVKNYLKEALPAYLDKGGFIQVQDLDKSDAIMLLQDFANRAVTYDIIERYGVANPSLASLFLSRCIANSARELSINKTNNDFKSAGMRLSRDQLSKLLGYFRDSFIINTVREFTRSISNNAKAASKVYAIDTGMFKAFSPAPANDVGQALETAVYMHLKRMNSLVRKGSISSVKLNDHGKMLEVDFIVGDVLTGAIQSLIQVCADMSNAKTRERELKALAKAMSHYRIDNATIITLSGKDSIDLPEGRVEIVPAWEWLYE